jgi:membrane associated rhomboid family serine protease
VPLSDRDYMRRRPPPSGGYRRVRSSNGFVLNPVWVLIGLNFLFYIATLVNGNITGQLGLIPLLFTERPWTLVSAMFIHAGFWHILANMITLFFFGTALYRIIGQNKFLLLYFGGGILGNLLYILLGEPISIVVGASGAIFAVAGALAVLVPKLQVRVYFIIPMPLWVVVIIFFGLWSIPNFVTQGIAWQAHLGGLVAGLIAGYFFRRSRRYYYIW